jgi:hypothetical protein
MYERFALLLERNGRLGIGHSAARHVESLSGMVYALAAEHPVTPVGRPRSAYNVGGEFVHFLKIKRVDIHFHGKVDKIVLEPHGIYFQRYR